MKPLRIVFAGLMAGVLILLAGPADAACCQALTRVEGFSGDGERFPDNGLSQRIAFNTKGTEHDVAIWPTNNRANECPAHNNVINVEFALWEWDAGGVLNPDDHMGTDKIINICHPSQPDARWNNVNGGNELFIKAEVRGGFDIHGADFKYWWWGDPNDAFTMSGGEKRH